MSKRRPQTIRLPPGVHAVTAKGRRYYYLSRNRGTTRFEQIRLPDDPRDPSWWAAYREALGIPAPPGQAKSVTSLIAEFKKAPEWTDLAHSTRANWVLHFRRVEEEWGKHVPGIRPVHVRALRDRYADRPGAANNLLRALSSLMTWAVEHEWRDDNPAKDVQKLKLGDGSQPWPPEIIALATGERAPVWMREAVALALYTGQRQGDCLRMRWAHISKDGFVSVRQRKTNKMMEVAIHRDLKVVLDAIPRRAVTILTSPQRRTMDLQRLSLELGEGAHGSAAADRRSPVSRPEEECGRQAARGRRHRGGDRGRHRSEREDGGVLRPAGE